MNLDLLKKLTRLANNNPNENEANLAARKVAKMLQEGDWSIPIVSNTTPPRNGEPTIRTYENPQNRELHIVVNDLDRASNPKIIDLLKQLEYEIKRPKTWNDVRRSEEPMWRSKPPTEAQESAKQQQQREEHQKRQQEFYERYYSRPPFSENDFLKDFFKGVDFGKGNPFVDFGKQSNAYSQRSEARDLKCTKCGHIYRTFYVGNLFVCYQCQFRAEP